MSRWLRAHLTYANVLVTVILFVVLGGTALAATGQVVNIADPTTPAHVASVASNGALKVSDGSGPMTVDGTVTAQQAAASTFQHSAVLGLTGNRGCVAIAQPPANKAMIVREVRVDVFNDPSPGPSQTVSIFEGLGCNTIVGDVNPPTVGQTVVPFDPGIGVPAGSGLSAFASGSVQAETYTDGYSVPSSQVPASAVSQSGRRAQR